MTSLAGMTPPSRFRFISLEWGRHMRVFEVGRMAKGISGVTVSRKAAYKYSTDMPTLNAAAPTMTP